jgi:hypothetical protein
MATRAITFGQTGAFRIAPLDPHDAFLARPASIRESSPVGTT